MVDWDGCPKRTLASSSDALFLSLRKDGLGEARGIVATAPAGGELFERIRTRLLSQEH